MDEQQERRHSRPRTCCGLTVFTLRHRTLPAVAEASSAHDHAVILFDGTCAFCEGGGEVHCSPRACWVFQVRRVAVVHSRCVARAVWHRPRDGPQHRAHRGWAGLSAVDGLATDCASSAVSVESRWRVAGRPTPTARRGLPRRRGRMPAAGRSIKCVRGAPARDPPAARVAHRGGDPVRLEFVVRPPLGAGPSPGSGRSNGHCSARHGHERPGRLISSVRKNRTAARQSMSWPLFGSWRRSARSWPCSGDTGHRGLRSCSGRRVPARPVRDDAPRSIRPRLYDALPGAVSI